MKTMGLLKTRIYLVNICFNYGSSGMISFILFILFLMFIPLPKRTLRLLLSIIYGFDKSDDLDGGGHVPLLSQTLTN